MAVTYPLTMPGTPGFRASRFALTSNVAVFASALTGVEQVLERDGTRWMAEYSLPPMLRSAAAAWIAFLVSFRGRRGFFKGFDPDAKTPRGVATGTPLVNGASQTGNALATDGWTINITGILKAGDYLSLALPQQRLYQVVEDANSNASGQATLSIEPHLREAPNDNAALTVTNPFGHFRLLANEVGWNADEVSVFGLSFAAAEAL